MRTYAFQVLTLIFHRKMSLEPLQYIAVSPSTLRFFQLEIEGIITDINKAIEQQLCGFARTQARQLLIALALIFRLYLIFFFFSK